MDIKFAHAEGVDFGYCRWCQKRFEYHSVEVRLQGGDEVFVLNDVPQGYCPSCGSLVYQADTLERIEAVYAMAQAR